LYKYEKGLEEIKKLEEKVDEEKKERLQKEGEIKLLQDRIQLCEEHLQYIEKNPKYENQPSAPLLQAIAELQRQCQTNYHSQKILV
jgi:peptide methionine sulfoxide reductase MsrA